MDAYEMILESLGDASCNANRLSDEHEEEQNGIFDKNYTPEDLIRDVNEDMEY